MELSALDGYLGSSSSAFRSSRSWTIARYRRKMNPRAIAGTVFTVCSESINTRASQMRA